MASTFLVVLAGGTGTRLWPLSRQHFPKQFLKIGSQESLVRETVSRFSEDSSSLQVLIVAGRNHEFLLKNEFPDFRDDQFLFEPTSKNSAAAIALVSRYAFLKDPDSVLVVLPADHKVHESSLPVFRKLIQNACDFAKDSNGLITFGIHPRFPATGYGYIQKGKKSEKNDLFFKVSHFREKPDFETAEKYLKEGGYYWNSGMFVFKASSYLREYQKFCPEDSAKFMSLDSKDLFIKNEKLDEVYSTVLSISVDYAILEKSDQTYLLPMEIDWDDVGSFDSLMKYYPKDEQENHANVPGIFKDSSRNLILSDKGIVNCIGVENLIVIREGDALLVISKDRVQEIKKLLEEMKLSDLISYL